MGEEKIARVLDVVENLDDLSSSIPWSLATAIYRRPFLPLTNQTYRKSLQQMEHNGGGSR
jgi:hypothetical protein